ncbi:hypothetical protein QBZ16_005371 [Prototheca wickerhamii]|uniref:Uncharacterized protein n=1 Tax=Prototheca wickerhamii TaxID=3111 RepID=A0AAD9IE67_PROWI|nr:hypothetical protein QBZ16_005371 [Prototheca wickerhamii]
MGDTTAQASQALAAKDWESAASLFSKAVEEDAPRAEALKGRATAYQKLGRHQEALEDALAALNLDKSDVAALGLAACVALRGCLGRARFALGDFGAAREAYERLSELEPGKRVHRQWVDMCRVRSGEELPLAEPQAAAAPPRAAPAESPPERSARPAAARIDDADAAAPAAAPALRHQWFQTDAKVEVAVLVKGLRAEQAAVQIQREALSIEVADRGYRLALELGGPVDPERSRWAVTGTKVEVVLHKAAPGVSWKDLERRRSDDDVEETVATAAPAAPAPGVPSTLYPYAGKKVDWDALDREAAQQDAEDGPAEGDEGVMKFFKELYANGDEDFRRAMVKSYVNSGGTELSTNWDEVSTKDYVPPSS